MGGKRGERGERKGRNKRIVEKGGGHGNLGYRDRDLHNGEWDISFCFFVIGLFWDWDLGLGLFLGGNFGDTKGVWYILRRPRWTSFLKKQQKNKDIFGISWGSFFLARGGV